MNRSLTKLYIVLLSLFLLAPFFSALAQDEEKEPLLYIIPFEGEVEIGLLHVLTKGYDQAAQEGADTILLEMDTPGGRVDAALDIVDLILDSEIPTVIYVKGDATSAGAIISLAADKIYMEEMATIGTASPVLVGSGGESETMESKALSFVLAKVRTICEQRGFDETKTKIALAMVDKEMEVKDPDDPDKFLTRKGVPLTLTAKEADRLGFITGVVTSREQIKENLGLAGAQEMYRYEHPSERIARFFASTAVTSLLLTVGFLGIFIEIRTPGFGIPGIVGVLALALFFWGHAIAHFAGYEGPLLFVIGVLLLSLEFFIIPGFGFTGVAGFLCMFGSIVITLLDRPITDPNFIVTFDWTDLSDAVILTSFTMVIGFSIAMVMPMFFPMFMRTRMGGWVLMNDVVGREQGYTSSPDQAQELLGKQGISRSTLRPAGIAEIDGQRVDVVSVGGYIPSHTPVEVIKVEGRRIVVRKI